MDAARESKSAAGSGQDIGKDCLKTPGCWRVLMEWARVFERAAREGRPWCGTKLLDGARVSKSLHAINAHTKEH